ncbi:MAG TPA: class II aldolase/adducin family protein [Dehalococcoidia bacterium]|nr:class II aldolase/adducin family protein [Dehalococcoidia bacterium]
MTSSYRERELAETVAQACRVLGAYDMTHAALGHVSYRLDDDTMLIKGKGPNEVGLRYTRARDIIKADLDANMVDGPDDLQPPSESFIHTWIYRTRPEVKSVLHVHAEYSVLLSITGKEIVHSYGAYRPGSKFARDGVPIYPSSVLIQTDAQGQELARVMGEKDVCILLGHGIAVAGKSIEECTMNALALEKLAEVTYKSYLIGTPRPLPQSDLNPPDVYAEGRKTRGSVGGNEGMMATWRYYVSVAEERLRGAQ